MPVLIQQAYFQAVQLVLQSCLILCLLLLAVAILSSRHHRLSALQPPPSLYI